MHNDTNLTIKNKEIKKNNYLFLFWVLTRIRKTTFSKTNGFILLETKDNHGFLMQGSIRNEIQLGSGKHLQGCRNIQ